MTHSEPAMRASTPSAAPQHDSTLTPGMRKIVLHAQLQLRKTFAWYRELSADNLQRVNVMIEHALAQFNTWLQVYRRNPDHAPIPETTRIFVLAPLELKQQISLQQTLELTRFFVQLLEEHVSGFATPGTEQLTRDAVALYAKEIAFSAASVYAQAADPTHTAEHTEDLQFRYASALAWLLEYCSFMAQTAPYSASLASDPLSPAYTSTTPSAATSHTTSAASTTTLNTTSSTAASDTTTSANTGTAGTSTSAATSADATQSAYSKSASSPSTPHASEATNILHQGSVSRETFEYTQAADALFQLGWDMTLPATVLVGSINHPQSAADMQYSIEHNGGQCIVATLQDIVAAQPSAQLLIYLHLAELAQRDPSLTVCVVSTHEDELVALCQQILPYFDSDSVCVGSTGTDAAMAKSLCEALSAVRALPALITPPRIVYAHTLLPERALLGDPLAKQQLIETVLMPLVGNAASLEDLDHDSVAHTVAVFLRSGSSLETASQLLHVHPNTVRYRLKRSAELTGWDPLVARDAYVLLTAISLGLMQRQ